MPCHTCSALRIIPDPDPHDSFCSDDKAGVCSLTPNPDQDLSSIYLSDRNEFRVITCGDRPYQVLKQCDTTPDWCPLTKLSPPVSLSDSTAPTAELSKPKSDLDEVPFSAPILEVKHSYPKGGIEELPSDYQPDHAIQKAWDKTEGGCLCGHTESCGFCDGSMNEVRKALKEAAAAVGLQLYSKLFKFHKVE